MRTKQSDCKPSIEDELMRCHNERVRDAMRRNALQFFDDVMREAGLTFKDSPDAK